MSILSKLRRQKALSLGLLLFTLAIGILIGTLINTGVKAERGQAATDAEPLTVPDPVQLSSEFTKLARKLEPAVVYIQTEYAAQPQRSSRNRPREDPREEFDFFRRFFGGSPEGMPQPRRTASGSGFVVDPKGYIITNLHVIRGGDEIKVRLFGDETDHDATLTGVDGETDLAVIKIDAGRPLPAVEIGNSDAVQVGDWAVAIGSPFGLESTVTAGIISAKGRDLGAQQFQRFIQTDAAINRGNSGGPLLNIRGEVIGVNTMIATRSGGYDGIGFALPMNMAVKVYNMIIKSGRVTRGSIGVSFGTANEADLLKAMGVDHGVVVSQVKSGGPASTAGIKPEDVLLSIDGKPVKDGDDLVARVADTPVGTEITITVDREGKQMDFPVTIEDRAELWKDDPRFSFYREQQEAKPGESAEARFGIYVRNLSAREREELDMPDDRGILVTRIESGSFAEDIGLRESDVITSINRRPVASIDDLKSIQATLSSGDAVAFRVMRSFPQSGRDRGPSLQGIYLVGKLP